MFLFFVLLFLSLSTLSREDCEPVCTSCDSVYAVKNRGGISTCESDHWRDFVQPSVEKGPERRDPERSDDARCSLACIYSVIYLDRGTCRSFSREEIRSSYVRRADQSCRVAHVKARGVDLSKPGEFSRCRFSNVDAVSLEWKNRLETEKQVVQ